MDQNEDIHLAQFDHHMYADTEYDTHYYKQSYSGLVLKIHLIRRINYQILETYLPSIIYVCIAFFAILVPADKLPVRAGMGMFTLLTMTTLKTQVRSQVPQVSYLTYMDLWIITCMGFIFSSIVIIVSTSVLNKKGREDLSQKIEFWVRLLYPIFFLVLNLIYWIVILSAYFSEKDDGH